MWGSILTILVSVVYLHTSTEKGVPGLVSSKADWLQGSWWSKDACEGWDPDGSVEDDPVECLKARQYRQVQRVLERESDDNQCVAGEIPVSHSSHSSATWAFTARHNIPTLQTLLHCFLPQSHVNYTACPPKPVILSGWWYTAEVITEATTGEVIWQTGLMEQARELGITFIAFGPYENWITVAEMMPDV